MYRYVCLCVCICSCVSVHTYGHIYFWWLLFSFGNTCHHLMTNNTKQKPETRNLKLLSVYLNIKWNQTSSNVYPDCSKIIRPGILIMVVMYQMVSWQKPGNRKARIKKDSSEEDDVPLKPKLALVLDSVGDSQEEKVSDKDDKPLAAKVSLFENVDILFCLRIISSVCVCVCVRAHAPVHVCMHVCSCMFICIPLPVMHLQVKLILITWCLVTD